MSYIYIHFDIWTYLERCSTHVFYLNFGKYNKSKKKNSTVPRTSLRTSSALKLRSTYAL